MEAKKVRRRRNFTAATPIDTDRHYFVQWPDFDHCLAMLMDEQRWLLITGPFQSGKSSLAYVAWVIVVTKLTQPAADAASANVVRAANDPNLTDMQAADAFFSLLCDAMEYDSRGTLVHSRPASSWLPQAGAAQVDRMFRWPLGTAVREPDVIWFLDEAGALNHISRPGIISSLLNQLRTCKEKSRGNRLRSFSLVGTAMTRKLLESARVRDAGLSYLYDPYDPLPPGIPISPLSLERHRDADFLGPEDIHAMLQDYGREHGVSFQIAAGGHDRLKDEQALHKFASSIHELTSGYKGLVGSCCHFIQQNSIRYYSTWRRYVRSGTLAKHVLNLRMYSRIVSNIPTYSETLQQLILDCVLSLSGGRTYTSSARGLDLVLPAINDGVLTVDEGGITVSSGMLLAALFEDCTTLGSAQEVSAVDSFEEAVRVSFRYMMPHRLLMDEVLNLNGQPSEYIWQCEFLLALKFVLEKGYTRDKYKILVECKKSNKRGERKVRLDFYLRNHGSQPRAFEVQARGDADSIKKHLTRSDKYRRLFADCEMNYIYFVVGRDDGARDVIARESSSYRQVKCWFVQYLEEERSWNIEQLRDSGWHSVVLAAPSSYPKFKFAARQF